MNHSFTFARPSSELLKLGWVVAIILVLQIPILRIDGLVRERQLRADSAIAEVTEKSGRTQAIDGPALLVPFTRTTTAPGGSIGNYELLLLPTQLDIEGRLVSEQRRRGIFSIPVYTVELQVKGRFESDDIGQLEIDLESIDWSRARLMVGISEVRTLQSLTRLDWGGKTYDFLPGLDSASAERPGIHAPLDIEGLRSGVDFVFPLTLSGSQGLYFVPNGRESSVSLVGDSGFVSFQGKWLPIERELSDTGFSAKWSVPYLARNYPQAWIVSKTAKSQAIEAALAQARFGVELLTPVDAYRMADRSVKYALLFLVLTFALVWMLEVTAKLQVHPIQYLLVGVAMLVFYLLELSLAEHLPFGQGYLLAGMAVVGLCAAYSAAVLRRWRRAAYLGAALVGLYGYLYIVLTNEDHALLVGSIGLFLVLAFIMYATRGVDWYAGRAEAGDRPEPGKSSP